MTPSDRDLFRSTFQAEDPLVFIKSMSQEQREEYSRLLDKKAASVEADYESKVEAVAQKLEALSEAKGLLQEAAFWEVPEGLTPMACVAVLRGLSVKRRLAVIQKQSGEPGANQEELSSEKIRLLRSLVEAGSTCP